MYKKMMVPLDGSELAECVLPHAEAFLERFNLSDVSLVRVVEPVAVAYGEIRTQGVQTEEDARKSSAKAYLEEVKNRILHGGNALRTEVLLGTVSESLIDYVEKNHIDLILIATHGRSGVTRWVRGSVADRILHAAHVPVFMIRAPGTKGPARL